MVKNYSSLIFLIAVILFTAYFTFNITKDKYKEQPKPDTVYIQNEIDSTYVYELIDSLEYLQNINNDTIYIPEIVYVDTGSVDTIYVKPTAFKEYSYNKPFEINDDSNTFNFNVKLSGTDSLFVDKLQNYLIKKQFSIEVNDFRYNISYIEKPEDNDWLALFVGIGNGYYKDSEKTYYSGKIGCTFIIKEKHIVTINKSFILDGYEVFYMYKLFTF